MLAGQQFAVLPALVADDDDDEHPFCSRREANEPTAFARSAFGVGDKPHRVGIVDGFGCHLDGGAVRVPHVGDGVAGPMQLRHWFSVWQTYDIRSVFLRLPAVGTERSNRG